jgi:hypothetical protein
MALYCQDLKLNFFKIGNVKLPVMYLGIILISDKIMDNYDSKYILPGGRHPVYHIYHICIFVVQNMHNIIVIIVNVIINLKF